MDNEKKLKQIVREEIGKLSKLTWGQRFGYIWDYYKPLMVAVIGIIALISLGLTIYHNLQLNYLMKAFLVNCNSEEWDSDLVESEFADWMGGIGEKDVILVDSTINLTDDTSQYGMASQMKLTALTTAAEMDVMIVDEATFWELTEQGYFGDLSVILSEEQLQEWSDILIRDSGSGTAIALDMTNASVLNRCNAYYGEAVYGAVIDNSTRMDLCDDFFDYLLSEESGVEAETDSEISAE